MEKALYLQGRRIDNIQDLPVGTLLCAEVRKIQSVSDFSCSYASPDLSEEDALRIVKSLLSTGRKIPAIKFVRQCTWWGLKESKTFVESLDY